MPTYEEDGEPLTPDRQSTNPRRGSGVFAVIAGVVLIVIGAVGTLQGVGVLGGSPMTGVVLWVYLGPLVALGGLVAIVLGLRRPRGRE